MIWNTYKYIPLRRQGRQYLITTNYHLQQLRFKSFRTIDLTFGSHNHNNIPNKRNEKIFFYNYDNTSKIKALDRQFKILNKSQTKILELGFIPSNWLIYIRDTMAKLHNISDPGKIHQKCHILGFDILFGSPPIGVSSIQGNIFSKLAHKNIINHFKEISWTQLRDKRQLELDIDPKSYFSREQDESMIIDKQIERIEAGLKNITMSDIKRQQLLDKRDSLLPDYRIDLILSDLSKPGYQQSGFYDLTETNPYHRYNNNKGLNHSILQPGKSNFEFLDAALLLSGDLLRPGGKFVARLNEIDPYDPEMYLLHEKLEKVFNDVLEIRNFGHTTATTTTTTITTNNNDNDMSFLVQPPIEKYYICNDKKNDDEYDLYDIFKY